MRVLLGVCVAGDELEQQPAGREYEHRHGDADRQRDPGGEFHLHHPPSSHFSSRSTNPTPRTVCSSRERPPLSVLRRT